MQQLTCPSEQLLAEPKLPFPPHGGKGSCRLLIYISPAWRPAMAPLLAMERLDELTQAVAALDLRPRTHVWTSLTWCVLDAVWSIGARYESVVVPTVRRVASTFGDEYPLVATDAVPDVDPVPLETFLERYGTEDALIAVTNRNRTSSRNGITKAAAAIQYATILAKSGVNTRADAVRLLSRGPGLDVNVQLRSVRGEGSGARRAYLWMLAGSDDTVKPDRMLMRFLARHGTNATLWNASEVIRAVAVRLSTPERPVTAWMVDHAIWTHESTLARSGDPS